MCWSRNTHSATLLSVLLLNALLNTSGNVKLDARAKMWETFVTKMSGKYGHRTVGAGTYGFF